MPASNWVGRAHAWRRMTQYSFQRNPLEQSICKRRGNRGDRRAFESHLQNQDRSRAQGNYRANAQAQSNNIGAFQRLQGMRQWRRDALDRRFNKKHGRHDGIPGIGMSVNQADELVGEYASDKEPREIRNAHNADRQSQQSRKVTRIRVLVTMHHPRLDVRTRSAREWARKTGECAAYSEHGYLPRIGEIQQKPR